MRNQAGIEDQGGYGIRFDWGRAGARAITVGTDLTVIVDVLSFTTTVTVALDAGTVVLPYPSGDESAAGYAADHQAALAVSRSRGRPGERTLSPASFRSGEPVPRVVLPSPNGSAISFELGARGIRCIAGGLRNAGAVADFILNGRTGARTIAFVAAGERWPDGSLRPAIEDLWGAGAIIAALDAGGWRSRSPEAELAMLGYEAVRDRVPEALRTCASGRELIAMGYPGDVDIAAELKRSSAVPILEGYEFVAG